MVINGGWGLEKTFQIERSRALFGVSNGCPILSLKKAIFLDPQKPPISVVKVILATGKSTFPCPQPAVWPWVYKPVQNTAAYCIFELYIKHH
jgi:hypothetical protein